MRLLVPTAGGHFRAQVDTCASSNILFQLQTFASMVRGSGFLVGLFLLVLLAACTGAPKPKPEKETIEEVPELEVQYRILAQDLRVPWELIWGPDDALWMTNNGPQAVLRLDPDSGTIDTFLIADPFFKDQPPIALLGLALHPQFPEVSQVFVSFMYTLESEEIAMRCCRYEVQEAGLLTQPLVIVDGIFTENSWLPGGALHITQDEYLLIATSNQHSSNTHSRNPESLSGKILRYNLDGTIPTENPFDTPVFSLGHRNPQGITELPNQRLFACEHGPNSDDELNELMLGADYGWPDVSGFCDTEEEKVFCSGGKISQPVKNWTPTIAPSSVDYLPNNQFTPHKDALLISTLKEADLRLLTFSEDQQSLEQEYILMNEKLGRLRNVAVSPEGRVFVCTANQVPENFTYKKPLKTEGLPYDVVVEVFPKKEAISSTDAERSSGTREQSP